MEQIALNLDFFHLVLLQFSVILLVRIGFYFEIVSLQCRPLVRQAFWPIKVYIRGVKVKAPTSREHTFGATAMKDLI